MNPEEGPLLKATREAEQGRQGSENSERKDLGYAEGPPGLRHPRGLRMRSLDRNHLAACFEIGFMGGRRTAEGRDRSGLLTRLTAPAISCMVFPPLRWSIALAERVVTGPARAGFRRWVHINRSPAYC